MGAVDRRGRGVRRHLLQPGRDVAETLLAGDVVDHHPSRGLLWGTQCSHLTAGLSDGAFALCHISGGHSLEQELENVQIDRTLYFKRIFLKSKSKSNQNRNLASLAATKKATFSATSKKQKKPTTWSILARHPTDTEPPAAFPQCGGDNMFR